MKNINIAVVGSGPAGIFSAIFASKNPQNKVFIFEKDEIFQTILPTGHGRCNLSFAEYDFKELVKYYPRGEKFLYSVFSKYSVAQTLDFFMSIGIETYIQPDLRIFPVSNSAKDVRKALLLELKKAKNIFFIKDEVIEIIKDEKFVVKTKNYSQIFDKVIVSTGLKNILKTFDLEIHDFKPSLCALDIKENQYYSLAGVSLENIKAKINSEIFEGNLLFTHKSISGPLVYKISSLNVEKNFPYEIFFELYSGDLNNIFEINQKKDILNALCETNLPKSFLNLFLESLKINPTKKVCDLKKEERILINNNLNSWKFSVLSSIKGGEIVSFGGIDLDEINSKTMQSKKYEGLFFCGEALNVDGFTGGFNLQN